MSTLNILYLAIIVGIFYLWKLIKDKKYRLLLPCVVHTGIWIIVCILISFTILGVLGEYEPNMPDLSYDRVAPFILGIMISSMFGFSLAHYTTKEHILKRDSTTINIKSLDYILGKYHWICYVCAVLGIMQISYLLSNIGFEGIADYRIMAVTTERHGFGAISQQLSGHATILGCFYLGLLGCKHGISNVNLRTFFLDAFLISLTNIAIAGRGWIITTMLPYIVGYVWQKKQSNKIFFDNDIKKIFIILVLFMSIFSVFGTIRNETEASGLEKFLYLTDGSRIANLILTIFPDGSFNYEFGAAEFLSKWHPSPMFTAYKYFISDDVGLMVTVTSSLPFLYFDFGFWGGIFMWGVFCFIIEKYAIKLRNTNSIIGAIIFIELCKLLFQSPIGPIFYMSTPIAQWILILFFFRKKIFI